MISSKETFSNIASQSRSLESVIERLGFNRNSWEFSIEEACMEMEYNTEFVISILKAFDDHATFPKKELMRLPTELIVDYLKKTHAYYINKKLPEIEQSIHKIKDGFADTHPLLSLLGDLFIDYKKDLSLHILNEEKILFPYIEYLLDIRNNNYSGEDLHEILSENILDVFTADHHDVEESLGEIIKIISTYAPSSDVFPFNIFLNQLRIFENDLLKHALVEDEILIPQVKEIESQAKQRL